MEFRDNKSVDICRIALKMSISSREEEKRLIKEYAEKKIKDVSKQHKNKNSWNIVV